MNDMKTTGFLTMDRRRLCRWAWCLVVLSVLLGIPSSLGNGAWAHVTILGMDFLTFFDFISNSVLMPIVAFLICIFVGYVIKPGTIIDEAQQNGQTFKGKLLFTVVIRYIAPICILLILISSVLSAFGVFTI